MLMAFASGNEREVKINALSILNFQFNAFFFFCINHSQFTIYNLNWGDGWRQRLNSQLSTLNYLGVFFVPAIHHLQLTINN